MQPFGRNRYEPKIGRLCPFGGGELGPYLTQCGRAEAYLHAKFHLDPSNCLATVHERHRQTDRQTEQRSDSIGQTVLQTVAQKCVNSTHVQALIIDHYIFILWFLSIFYLSSFFPHLISVAAQWMSTILSHMMWP